MVHGKSMLLESFGFGTLVIVQLEREWIHQCFAHVVAQYAERLITQFPLK